MQKCLLFYVNIASSAMVIMNANESVDRATPAAAPVGDADAEVFPACASAVGFADVWLPIVEAPVGDALEPVATEDAEVGEVDAPDVADTVDAPEDAPVGLSSFA